MDIHRKISRFILLFTAVFICFSCVTNAKITPKKNPALFIRAAASLPAGADGYFAADAKALSPLLIPLLSKYRMDSKDTRIILKKTVSAGGAYFAGEKTDAFIINLNGRGYPALGAKFVFGASKLWKKEQSGKKTFFYSERFRIALDVGAKKIKIAPRNPYFYAERPALNTELPEWLSGAAFTAWSPRAALLNNYLQSRRIDIRFPARSLYAALYPADFGNNLVNLPGANSTEKGEGYRLVLCVEAENEARAYSIQSLLRLARSAIEEGGLERIPEARRGTIRRILRAETSVDECNVFLDAGIFNTEELLQLFK